MAGDRMNHMSGSFGIALKSAVTDEVVDTRGKIPEQVCTHKDLDANNVCKNCNTKVQEEK